MVQCDEDDNNVYNKFYVLYLYNKKYFNNMTMMMFLSSNFDVKMAGYPIVAV